MKVKHAQQFINLIFPAVVFGSVTGILTAVVVTLYKWCAKYAVHWSEIGYAYLREHWLWLPAVVLLLFGAAALFSFAYKRRPNLRGGGIPTSIGILRGLISFRWLRNLVGTFGLSLMTFLIGVPLGTEGPSVQMGTAIGRGSVFSLAKKHHAWDRYSMTGGACAGFSVATGAPISGLMFAIEEAHQRISPMIVIVSATSVVTAMLTSEWLAPLFGVGVSLFPALELPKLSIGEIWIPLVTGLVVGLFAVLFLKFYQKAAAFFSEKLSSIRPIYKILGVFIATVLVGLFSFSFISTGHELILHLLSDTPAIGVLILILLVRSVLTISANTNHVTGGIFLPLLAIGAVLSALLGKGAQLLLGLDERYYSVILVFGITACIAGMMKSPLTAIFFALEALSCYHNLLYVIITAATAFIITEVFDVKSINDSVLEHRMETIHNGHPPKVFDTYVTIKKDAFAVGKQIRDIFWPANLFVLSVRHSAEHEARLDRHGGKELCEGDVLNVRYSTYDLQQTKRELDAIVGEQEDVS